MKKIIIQCSGRKNGELWTVNRLNGIKVKFVSHPYLCEVTPGINLFRPDDMVPDNSITWREYLSNYNMQGKNPDNLLRAGDLYDNKTYHILIDKFKWENVYILSAGFGLVRSDFYLPLYDITFSKKAKECNRRKKTDKFMDFNHLSADIKNNSGDSVYAFVTPDYLDSFYDLTNCILANKYIFYKSMKIKQYPGYSYKIYKSRIQTNWHYYCAQEFAITDP
jgi:hypothetical protein